jgi:sporulation protein YlmC with PRC-barrel domain
MHAPCKIDSDGAKEGKMLRRIMKDLRGEPIVARDGVIGPLKDVYFDDQRWGVRYLVVDTGRWLPGRKVLIPPASVEADGAGRSWSFRLRLSREEVEHSPPADSAPPVSRQFQEAHARYYRFNWYWTEPHMWGARPGSAAARSDEEAFRRMKAAETQAQRSHLRSIRAVAGYHIEASDGRIGHVEDFTLDDQLWTIAGVVVDTRNWLPGRKVLVAPAAVCAIDWRGRKVVLRMSCGELRRARDAL